METTSQMSSSPEIVLPEVSLVVLVGASASGKSVFASRHFQPTEVVSSDGCRAMICDDPADQAVTHQAFDLLHRIVSLRLRHRRLTVVDATNVTAHARRPLLELARCYDVPAVAVVLDVSEEICCQRDGQRPDRRVGSDVVEDHTRHLQASLDTLADEGFAHVYVLSGPDQIDESVVRRG